MNSLEILRQAGIGDLFNGTLEYRQDDRQRITRIIEASEAGLNFRVRTGMGVRDFCCLNFNELKDGNRYRFELIRQYSPQTADCRALSDASDSNLCYESLDNARKEEIRKEPLYEKGKELVVVPSRVEIERFSTTPEAVFHDPFFPNLTGFVYFSQPQCVKALLGRRILVKVGKMTLGNDRMIVRAEFIRRDEGKWCSLR